MHEELCPGIEYYNPRVENGEISQVNKPQQDLFDREMYPRMPWHDIQLKLSGMVVASCMLHFMQIGTTIDVHWQINIFYVVFHRVFTRCSGS